MSETIEIETNGARINGAIEIEIVESQQNNKPQLHQESTLVCICLGLMVLVVPILVTCSFSLIWVNSRLDFRIASDSVRLMICFGVYLITLIAAFMFNSVCHRKRLQKSIGVKLPPIIDTVRLRALPKLALPEFTIRAHRCYQTTIKIFIYAWLIIVASAVSFGFTGVIVSSVISVAGGIACYLYVTSQSSHDDQLSCAIALGVVSAEGAKSLENVAYAESKATLGKQLTLSLSSAIIADEWDHKATSLKPLKAIQCFASTFVPAFMHVTVGWGRRLHLGAFTFGMLLLMGFFAFTEPHSVMRKDEHQIISDTALFTGFNTHSALREKMSGPVPSPTETELLKSREKQIRSSVAHAKSGNGTVGDKNVPEYYRDTTAYSLREKYLVPQLYSGEAGKDFQHDITYRMRDAAGITLSAGIPFLELVIGSEWEPSRRPITFSKDSSYKHLEILLSADKSRRLTYQELASILTIFGWFFVPLLIGSFTAQLRKVATSEISE